MAIGTRHPEQIADATSVRVLRVSNGGYVIEEEVRVGDQNLSQGIHAFSPGSCDEMLEALRELLKSGTE